MAFCSFPVNVVDLKYLSEARHVIYIKMFKKVLDVFKTVSYILNKCSHLWFISTNTIPINTNECHILDYQ